MADPRSAMVSDFLHLIRDGCRYLGRYVQSPPVAMLLGVAGIVWIILVLNDISWLWVIAIVLALLCILGFAERGRTQSKREAAERLRREEEAKEERERQEKLVALEAERAEKERLAALLEARGPLLHCITWRRDDLQLEAWQHQEEQDAVDRARKQKSKALLLELDRDLELVL